MELVVILVALAVQRYTTFFSKKYRDNLTASYFDLFESKFGLALSNSYLRAVLSWALPLTLLAGILILLHYVFGLIASFLLNIIVLWFCIDGRDRRKNLVVIEDLSQHFSQSYDDLFSKIFWYSLLGPLGCVFLVLIDSADKFYTNNSNLELKSLIKKITGITDWIPVRLMGLSFALVGNFGSAFSCLSKHFFSGINVGGPQVKDFGLAALQVDAVAKEDEQKIFTLLDNTLLMWLVVIALINIIILLS